MTFLQIKKTYLTTNSQNMQQLTLPQVWCILTSGTEFFTEKLSFDFVSDMTKLHGLKHTSYITLKTWKSPIKASTKRAPTPSRRWVRQISCTCRLVEYSPVYGWYVRTKRSVTWWTYKWTHHVSNSQNSWSSCEAKTKIHAKFNNQKEIKTEWWQDWIS